MATSSLDIIFIISSFPSFRFLIKSAILLLLKFRHGKYLVNKSYSSSVNKIMCLAD